MSQRATKHGDERLAQVLLESALDAHVTPHDDGSVPSMYDLEIRYRDGRLAAAEVVSTRDRRAIRLEAATSKNRYTSITGLLYTWFVMVAPSAQVRRVRQHLPAALAHLERHRVHRLSYRSFVLRQSGLADLGVTGCWSTAPTAQHPPGYYLLSDFKSEWGGEGDEIVRRCDEFLPAVPDVASKLVRSDLAERHAVVVVTVDWVGPFGGIQYGPVPTRSPILPKGIDRLWLVTLRCPPIRALYWLGDGIWREITLTADHLAGAAKSA